MSTSIKKPVKILLNETEAFYSDASVRHEFQEEEAAYKVFHNSLVNLAKAAIEDGSFSRPRQVIDLDETDNSVNLRLMQLDDQHYLLVGWDKELAGEVGELDSEFLLECARKFDNWVECMRVSFEDPMTIEDLPYTKEQYLAMPSWIEIPAKTVEQELSENCKNALQIAEILKNPDHEYFFESVEQASKLLTFFVEKMEEQNNAKPMSKARELLLHLQSQTDVELICIEKIDSGVLLPESSPDVLVGFMFDGAFYIDPFTTDSGQPCHPESCYGLPIDVANAISAHNGTATNDQINYKSADYQYAELSVDTSTTAFDDLGVTTEIRNILRVTAFQVDDDWDGKPIMLDDTNGNPVGVLQLLKEENKHPDTKAGLFHVDFDLNDSFYKDDRNQGIAKFLLHVAEKINTSDDVLEEAIHQASHLVYEQAGNVWMNKRITKDNEHTHENVYE